MAKNVILVRCVRPTARLHQLVSDLSDEFPGYRVIPVPDLIEVDQARHSAQLDSFPSGTLPLTSDFLTSMNLPKSGTRTGWVCGDYVFYRALEEEWEYAWIVEPDVFFLNGSASLLKAFDTSAVDLITTNFWPASKEWVWHAPLAAVAPDVRVHAMSFPLSRLSRTLVEQSLLLRQKIAGAIREDMKLPNDESVVATAAHEQGASSVDMAAVFPWVFKHWSTIRKYPINDLTLASNGPLIVHSGLDDERFQAYLMTMWEAIDKGWLMGAEKIALAMEQASAKTMLTFINEIVAERVKGRQKD